jgi:hypothetical protein
MSDATPVPLDSVYLEQISGGLDRAARHAEAQPFDPAAERIVIFSDHHRGTGDQADDWRNTGPVKQHLWPVLGRIQVREALRLTIGREGKQPGTLLFVHGHQGTADSDRWGWASRVFVRYVWRPLQRRTGISAATTASDFDLRAKHDRAMYEWARTQEPGLLLVAGHTHRPVFARGRPDPPPTRSIGCCSFPDGDITGIEIADGAIRLVRWPANLHEMVARVGGIEAQKRILEEAPLEDILTAVTDEPAISPSVVEHQIGAAE